MAMTQEQVSKRLEYLRGELRAERISYGELAELQALAELIDPEDVELLEAAGVPEFEEERKEFFLSRQSSKTEAANVYSRRPHRSA